MRGVRGFKGEAERRPGPHAVCMHPPEAASLVLVRLQLATPGLGSQSLDLQPKEPRQDRVRHAPEEAGTAINLS